MNKKNVINIITALMALIVQYAISFIISPIIVKNLGEAANGYAQLANNLVSYVTLITVAFNSMAARFMSISYHQGQPVQMNQYYTSVGKVNLLLSFIMIPFSALLIFRLDQIIVIEPELEFDVKILFTCVFANFVLSLATSILSTALFVLNKIYIQNIISLVTNILRAIIILTLFYTFPPKIFYVSFTALTLTILSIPVYLYLKKKFFPWLRIEKGGFSKEAVKQLLRSGIWNTVNQCGHMLMTGMDLLMSNIFITPEAMGLLSVAKTFPSAINAIVTAVNGSFTASLTEEWSKKDTPNFYKELKISMKISSVLLSIPISVFIVFSIPFYKLWMPSLDSVQLAILSFLSIMQFIPWTGPAALFNVFTAANKLNVNALAFVCSGILNFIIVYFYLTNCSNGIFAIAGVSSVITIIRNVVITAPYTARLLGIKWYCFYKDVILSIACCGIVCLISIFVKTIFIIESWLTLIISVGISSFFSFGILIFVILNKNERGRIIKLTRINRRKK